MSLEFAYYPYEREVNATRIMISPLPNLDETIARVSASELVDNHWFYAPAQRSYDPISGQTKTRPYSARIFGLPKTHRIVHAATQDTSRLRFLMHCLGFFEGMRLDDTSAGFLDATPIVRGQLNDFSLSGSGLSRAMDYADEFWDAYADHPDIAMILLGVFRNLTLAHAPQSLVFETFIYSYTAIEGCFAIGRVTHNASSGGRHATRTVNLCNALQIPVPAWITNQSAVNVVDVRNFALHEGLFLGQPFGFASFHDVTVPDNERYTTNALPFAMRNLVCRFVVALLGLKPQSYLLSTPFERGAVELEL